MLVLSCAFVVLLLSCVFAFIAECPSLAFGSMPLSISPTVAPLISSHACCTKWTPWCRGLLHVCGMQVGSADDVDDDYYGEYAALWMWMQSVRQSLSEAAAGIATPQRAAAAAAAAAADAVLAAAAAAVGVGVGVVVVVVVVVVVFVVVVVMCCYCYCYCCYCYCYCCC